FFAFSFFTVISVFAFCGFAKVYLIERERCMFAHSNDLAQFRDKLICNENHEYFLSQNKVLRHAVYIFEPEPN
ncbi:MAG: hypothetical protein LBF01_02455, partial [Bacteroidales bacterium]|nr:hypothetical protein [Bacteroidales bacterium]